MLVVPGNTGDEARYWRFMIGPQPNPVVPSYVSARLRLS